MTVTDVVEFYKRDDGKWAWRRTRGGKVLSTDGGQGYENGADVERIAKSVNGDDVEYRNLED